MGGNNNNKDNEAGEAGGAVPVGTSVEDRHPP